MRLVALGTWLGIAGTLALVPAVGTAQPLGGSEPRAAASACAEAADRLLPRTKLYQRTPARQRRAVAVADPLCFDVTGDGRKDVIFAISGGGSGGAFDWVIFNRRARGGHARLAEPNAGTGHLRLRRSGSRVIATTPIYRRGDPNCCPTGGKVRRTYKVASGRVVLVRTVRGG